MRDINHHVPSDFCTYTTFAYGEFKDLSRLYRGEDCLEVLCNHIEKKAKRLYHMFPEKQMEQWREFSNVREYHICLQHFEPLETIVRNHCHYTRKHRSAAHQKCNFWYAIPHHILIFFHNLSGHDVHLFIRILGKSSMLAPSA